jgi:hypothetical protein
VDTSGYYTTRKIIYTDEPVLLRVVKYKRLGWAGKVAWMGQK